MSEGETEGIDTSEIESELVLESDEQDASERYDDEADEAEEKPTPMVVNDVSDEYEEAEEKIATNSEEAKEETQSDREVVSPRKVTRESFAAHRDSRKSISSESSRRKSTFDRNHRKSVNVRSSDDHAHRASGSFSVHGSRLGSTRASTASLSRRKTVQISKEVAEVSDKRRSKSQAGDEDDDDSGEWACPQKPLKAKAKVVAPPYQLWPVRKFNHHVVTKLIADALPRFFVDHVYHPTNSMDNLRMALTYIIRKVHQLRYDRRKLVVVGRLHENLGQSSFAIARFFWNPETDAYAHFTHQKPGFIVCVAVFAIYMD